MKTKHPNLLNLIAAAKALEPLNETIVFVGGATAILYVDEQSKDGARATVDVDCIVEVATRIDYQKIEAKMRKLGFQHDTSEGAPICRWLKGPLVVDLMPVDEKILGFTNKWYENGFSTAEKVKASEDVEISIFSFPYFIASKLEALMSRGLKDLTTSQDFEDILFAIDGRKTFFEDLSKAASEIQGFFRKSFNKIIAQPDFENAFRGNLPRGLNLQRQNQILAALSGF